MDKKDEEESFPTQQKLVETLGSTLERITKKQKICIKKTSTSLDGLLQELRNCKNELEHEKKGVEAISELHQKVQSMDVLSKLNQEHKEFHVTIAKFGKLIDKSFENSIEETSKFIFDQYLLNQIVAQHFFRDGRFELGETFVKEANINSTICSSLKDPFKEMHSILESMNAKKLQPAIEWAKRQGNGQELEFSLHRLYFIHLLTLNQQNQALAYARANFGVFGGTHLQEIEKLMTSLLFCGKLGKSPYSSLFSSELWKDAIYKFTSLFCSLLGYSYESPLYSVITAGTLALPKQLRIAELMQGKAFKFQAIEIELGRDFQYHPIFACPVSREQTSPENPPMFLVCGHVISTASITKLARGSSKFKCPYCPVEQRVKDPFEVFF